MQDVISREIVVKAKKEKVYSAITDPKQIVSWFPDSIEGGTLEVGQRPYFLFNGGKNKAQVYIEKSVPFSYFSYRWVPRVDEVIDDILAVPNTLVEFIIEEVAEGTKVTVKESGFSTLAASIAEESFKRNSGGWDFMMDRLQKLMNQN